MTNETDSPLQSLKQAHTLGEQAYYAIRDAIALGKLTAGQRLTERGMAQDLSVSPTPVREALRRLEQEGLVERGEHRDLYVSKLSLSSLAEVLMILGALRGIASRLAAEKITACELAELETLFRQTDEAFEADSGAQPYDLTQRFHQIVAQASRNDYLISILDTIAVFDSLHRNQVVEGALITYPLRESHAEHQAIAEALAAGDGARADELTRAHTARSADIMIAALREN